MEFNILEKKENPLLEREEIRFELSYAGVTPTFDEIRKELIKHLKADEKLTVLDSIHQEFGEHKARGYVKIYENAKAMEVEPEHRIKKNFEEEKAPASAETKEEKEKPSEEVKPEKKPKEKPVKEESEKEGE